ARVATTPCLSPLMRPALPTPTLFPYTTLFRSEGSRYFQSPLLYKENGFKEEKDARSLLEILSANPPLTAVAEKIEKKKENKNPRSEEHTSELQSRFDLVCRLLLEKKKKET